MKQPRLIPHLVLVVTATGALLIGFRIFLPFDGVLQAVGCAAAFCGALLAKVAERTLLARRQMQATRRRKAALLLLGLGLFTIVSSSAITGHTLLQPSSAYASLLAGSFGFLLALSTRESFEMLIRRFRGEPSQDGGPPH